MLPRSPAAGLAIRVIQEHQVDVGAVVEFIAAHLPQRDDGEMRFLPGARLRYSMLGNQLLADALVGRFDNRVGQRGEFAGDFRQRAQAQHVANQDAQQLAAAEAREFERRRQALRQRRFQHLAHLFGGEHPLQVARFEQLIRPTPGAAGFLRKGNDCR